MNRLFFENIVPGTLLFSEFRLIRCLSSSDEGGVYLCSRISEPLSQVALKVLLRSAIRSPERSAQFMHELALAQRLHSDYIVQVHAMHEDEEFMAISMEYVAGAPLSRWTGEEWRFDLPFALSVLEQLSVAIEQVHAAGILHRDVKPENVLISAIDTAKLIDFGIAVETSRVKEDPLPNISGTWDYLSPEFLLSGEMSPQMDIYALGILGYELLTGTVPVAGGSIFDSLIQRVRHDPPPPHLLQPAIPKRLGEIISCAIRRDPRDRFASAAAMTEELSTFIDEARIRKLAANN